ncbi:ML domain-containing protein [Globomyces pollinis-pini]|nr:ML domain-containing protein [Globomyces pollinis-pini]
MWISLLYLSFIIKALHLPSQMPLLSLSLSDSITWCSGQDDTFIPESVNLSPDPPARGESLTVELVGSLKKRVDHGSTARVKVKLGFIQLIDMEYDLCEETAKVGNECPFEKGPLVITTKLDLPPQVPPGHYKIHVEAFDQDQTPITCLNADFRM